MKISRKSWHYKLHVFAKSVWKHGIEVLPSRIFGSSRRVEYTPNTLCGYFWTTVLLTLALIPASIGILAVVLVLCLVMAGAYIGDLIGSWHRAWRVKHPAKVKLKTVRAPKPPREPSMLAHYIKAKKQRACPIITLVD